MSAAAPVPLDELQLVETEHRLCSLFNEEDEKTAKILYIISPLIALMEAQANDLNTKGIPSVCIHSKTQNKEQLMKDLGLGKFRIAIVRPETAFTAQFLQLVYSSDIFRDSCICKVVDEAHVVTEWGTDDFRPEYARIGTLRARLLPGTPILAVSATFPEAVIRDLQQKLGLDNDCAQVMVSNAKPNVALSVRIIQHPEDSMADLLSLIPHDASTADNIPITIIYVNGRTDAEDIQDTLRAALPESISCHAVEFYHRNISEERKSYILDRMRLGEIRLGLGECIVYVTNTFVRKYEELLKEDSLEEASLDEDAMEEPLLEEGIAPEDVETVRVERLEEEATAQNLKGKAKKSKFRGALAARDFRFLIWTPPLPTLSSDARCCDNCTPLQFLVPTILFLDLTRRKPGCRAQSTPSMKKLVIDCLNALHDHIVDRDWPHQHFPTGPDLLADNLVDAYASGAQFVDSLADLEDRARWNLINEYGSEILDTLRNLRMEFAPVVAEGLDDASANPSSSRHATAPSAAIRDKLKAIFDKCWRAVENSVDSNGKLRVFLFEAESRVL
ncbi:uncharacterized protein STEHIDRAFT_116811 [Stereum hirsutum FP-91666 SS1]|uniref:Helicase ATP-binding domain-containing protein n=1 Tax=Stereum hirsutum (strain FP-91666) TaxID=721885 RepID=R7RVI7_STEHR|nr:uncharacterized protein STEHIDRAFT_116811 [Stereum hirsutum FP-91666 SS1]EIM79071.1 hypothetical protein STEHIDRAFT_116811 [Stereum hirsutum FP-91666 SS1]